MKKNIFIISIIFNLLFCSLVVFKMANKSKEKSFSDKQQYSLQTKMFDMYPAKQNSIVMLGDSITYHANWNELTGAINRGLSGDYIEGTVKRLPQIYKLKPKTCFVMVGINNLKKDKPDSPEKVFKNYVLIINGLSNNNIKPVIQSVLYVGASKKGYKEINQRIYKLNDYLKEFSARNNIKFIDLNRSLAPDRILKDEYTWDGVHLTTEGYKVWLKHIGNG